MKPKGLLVALALLAVLGGALWFSNRQEAKKASAKTSDTNPKILSVADDQIKEIRIEKAGAPPVVLARNDAKKWQITAPKPLPADQDAAGQVASTLASLNSDKLIEENAADLAPYGLNNPSMNVTVLRKDGKSDPLLVGDETPTGSGAYVKLANDPRVFTLA